MIIAGGGTGGHVYPGLALAEAIRAAEPDAAIAFIGTSRGLEARAVPAAGYTLDHVDVLPWAKTLGARRLLAPLSALRAAQQARRILRKRKADIVASMGGYASLPAALAAWSAGIPLILHEQNAIPGRANRVAARLTRHIAVTFPESGRMFQRPVRVIGNPIRAMIAHLDATARRPEALHTFGLSPIKPTVLMLGGSQGAKTLNVAAEAMALRWSGPNDPQILLLAGDDAPHIVADSLKHVAFTDRMDLAYAAADVVVCRAGAGVMEVACAGLPSVLVPYPYAQDGHQAANADALARAGASVVVEDAHASGERLAREVEAILADQQRRATMSRAARLVSRPEAAHDLAAWVLECVEGAKR